MHIAQFCRFIKESFYCIGWKCTVGHNPNFALNGAVYLIMTQGDKDFLVTVQPIYSAVEVKSDDPLIEFLRKHERLGDGQGRFN